MKIYRKEGRFTKKGKKLKLDVEPSRNPKQAQELTPPTTRPTVISSAIDSAPDRVKQRIRIPIQTSLLKYFLPISNLTFNFGYIGGI